MERIVNRELGIKILRFIFIYSLFIIPYSISAQSVDLLWQGETYTPPFYQGRALWSSQSAITFVAIPQGLGNAANLNFKWTKNGTVLGNASGRGRNFLPYLDSIISKSQTIKVEVVSSQDTVLASNTIVVTPTSPLVNIYENNPLYGFMFHRNTAGTHELDGQEVTFTAFPFFFSAPNRISNALKYEWRTNTGGVETGNTVTYRIPDEAAGSSVVRAHVSNQERILQEAKNEFVVKFGEQ